MKKRYLLAALFAASLALAGGLHYSAEAFRGVAGCGVRLFNRCEQTGYFTGQDMFEAAFPPSTIANDGAGWLYEHGMGRDISSPANGGNGDNSQWTPADPNVTDAASFIALMNTDLNRGYAACAAPVTTLNAAANAQKEVPGSCYFNKKRAVGAAFIIDTMLNQPGTSYGSIAAGINYAKSHFALWSSMVNAYASGSFPGASVNFSFEYPFNNQFANNSSIVGYGSDEAFFTSQEADRRVIIFRHPDGSTYIIKKMCGNITGNAAPFPDFLVSGILRSGLGAPTTPGAGGTLHASTTYQIDAGAWNAGPGVAQPNETYTLTLPAGVNPVVIGGGGVRVGNTIVWSNVQLPNTGFGNAVYKNLQFNVNGVPNNTNITFSLVVGPRNLAGGNAPPVTITYLVNNFAYPYVTSGGSDVHAGGGICNLATGSGTITGNGSTPGASGNEYVVSASGAPTSINNFYSNGSAAISSLNLGANGGYAQVCRPNLLAAALAYTGPRVNVGDVPPYKIGAGTTALDVTGLPAGVYFYTGSQDNLDVYGTITSKITVVNTHGYLIAAQPLKLDTTGTYTAATLPSVGMIASDGILMHPAATQVDAYMFTPGFIDTCWLGAVTQSDNRCATTQTIHGFLMGRTIYLARLGAAGSTGATQAENVIMNPQIYLNPPALFDSSVDQTFLSGQGERAPLF